MKRVIFIIFLVFFLAISAPLYALDSTKSGSATQSAKPDSKESEILNQVSDKVSQLGATLKRAASGKVRSLGNDTFSLTTDQSEVFVETNEATNIYRIRAGSRTDSDFKSVKIGDE